MVHRSGMAGGASGANRISCGRALAEADGHFYALSECMEEMLGLGWWRLGETYFRFVPWYGAQIATFRRAAAAARERWQAQQAIYFAHVEEAGPSGGVLAGDLERALGDIEVYFALIVSMERTQWWRAGVALRRLTGVIGLKPAQFEMASTRARDEHGRYLRHTSGVVATKDPPGEASTPLREAAPLPAGIYAAHLAAALKGEGRPSIAWMLHRGEQVVKCTLDALPHEAQRPLVSIVMPAYNRAHLIAEAIQSVKEQQWPHWELFVCDDGSEDETGAVVLAEKDERIRHLKLSHGGAARARNAGLQAARGTYIAYLDSDNLWHPFYLSVMLSQLMAHPDRAVAYGNFVEVVHGDEGRQRVRPVRPRDFSFARLLEKSYIDLNTIVHTRALYEALGGFDEALPQFQDWDLMLKYGSATDPVYVDAPLALYRIHSGWSQISQTQAQGRFRNRDAVLSNVDGYRERGRAYRERSAP
ncbi:MAG: glycosyltransferase family 2 protein [Candidatus Hydrogenedentes bacterium]|nr:glycosyltransferase family 2 protein [Candidatus Hydrogenedentota bacterium]